MDTNISYSVREDCLNFQDTMGEICVFCNCCGRVNEETKYDAQLQYYKKCLQSEYEFDNWIEGWEDRQKQNIQDSIEYYKEKITEVENIISNY